MGSEVCARCGGAAHLKSCKTLFCEDCYFNQGGQIEQLKAERDTLRAELERVGQIALLNMQSAEVAEAGLKRAQTRIAELEAAMAWRPIEELDQTGEPYDTEGLLLWDTDGAEEHVIGSRDNGEWVSHQCGWKLKPSHYIPLPKRPLPVGPEVGSV